MKFLFFRSVCAAFILSLYLSKSFALMKPHTLEIDGQKFSVHDSMDLILGRIDKNVIADFSSVKLDGQDMVPYNLTSGTAIFLRTEDGDGDTQSYDEKLRSNKKIAVLCDSKAAGVPDGISIKKTIALSAGQAVFLMTYDNEYKVNNRSINLYLCPGKSPTKSSSLSTLKIST